MEAAPPGRSSTRAWERNHTLPRRGGKGYPERGHHGGLSDGLRSKCGLRRCHSRPSSPFRRTQGYARSVLLGPGQHAKIGLVQRAPGASSALPQHARIPRAPALATGGSRLVMMRRAASENGHRKGGKRETYGLGEGNMGEETENGKKVGLGGRGRASEHVSGLDCHLAGVRMCAGLRTDGIRLWTGQITRGACARHDAREALTRAFQAAGRDKRKRRGQRERVNDAFQPPDRRARPHRCRKRCSRSKMARRSWHAPSSHHPAPDAVLSATLTCAVDLRRPRPLGAAGSCGVVAVAEAAVELVACERRRERGPRDTGG